MAQVTFDLRRNNDGTITAIHGKHRASFTAEPWMSETEIVERARWELISLGVAVEIGPDDIEEADEDA
jgi:hypothetical protein